MRDEQRCIMWRHLLLSTNQSEIYWFLNGFCLKVVTHPSTKPARPGLTSELVCLPSLFLAKILSQTPPSPSSDFLLSVFSLYPRESCPAWIECCWSRIDDVFFLQNGPPFCAIVHFLQVSLQKVKSLNSLLGQTSNSKSSTAARCSKLFGQHKSIIS